MQQRRAFSNTSTITSIPVGSKKLGIDIAEDELLPLLANYFYYCPSPAAVWSIKYCCDEPSDYILLRCALNSMPRSVSIRFFILYFRVPSPSLSNACKFLSTVFCEFASSIEKEFWFRNSLDWSLICWLIVKLSAVICDEKLSSTV